VRDHLDSNTSLSMQGLTDYLSYAPLVPSSALRCQLLSDSDAPVQPGGAAAIL